MTGAIALPEAEIVRELKRYRYDPHDIDNTGRGRVPIKGLSDYLGIRRECLHRYIFYGRIPKRRIVPLSDAIMAIRNGKLKFVRHGQTWNVEGAATRVI